MRVSILVLALWSGILVWGQNTAMAQCPETRLINPNTDDNERFGRSVSIHGDVAVVGVPLDNARGSASGNVFVYRWNGALWEEEAQLLGSDTTYADYFGESVSVHEDLIVVGAPGKNGAAVSSGGIYIFRWNGLSWVEEAQFDHGDLYTRMGFSVSVKGNKIIAGAPATSVGDVSGSVYIFEWNGLQWHETAHLYAADRQVFSAFGYDVDVDGDLAVVGSPNWHDFNWEDDLLETGAIYIFRKTDGEWTQEAMRYLEDHKNGDWLGTSVAIQGDLILAGAPGVDSQRERTTNEGAAYFFEWDSGTWKQGEELIAKDRNGRAAKFGVSVSFDNGKAIVGSHLDDVWTGAAYVYHHDGHRWVPGRKVVPFGSEILDEVGYAVGISGERAILGAPSAYHSGYNAAGFAYILSVGGTKASRWDLLGFGRPGTNGIPQIETLQHPVIGTDILIRAENSLGAGTSGILLIGLGQLSLPGLHGGGEIIQYQQIYPMDIPEDGIEFPFPIPCDSHLIGLSMAVQLLENDPQALGGFSITPGLQLFLGDF